MKQRYRELCRQGMPIPLYLQDWWLDAVCGFDEWMAFVLEEEGTVSGVMPCYMPVPGHISMPPFTQFLGSYSFIGINEDSTTSFRTHRRVHDMLRSMLPPHKSFMVQYSKDFTDWLPYYWQGYSQTTRYTYRIDLSLGIDVVRMAIRPDAMKKIRKGERDGLRYTSATVDDLLRLCRISMSRQEAKGFVSETLQRLAEVAIERHAGEIVGCEDSEGRLLAAVFLAHDHNTAYTIASGQIREGQGRNAGAFALYEAIWRACEMEGIHTFDFEGSMLEGVEGFFRSFGGVQTPYFRLSKGRIGLCGRLRRKWRTFHDTGQQKQV
ncbi:GNAT family N-acetyltransferase [Porphyromonas gingivalis]|uniref:GNAT family N-acetyltransferase n=1 Tax=Porphyromonas gingivalis TaxID=837 RepID=UPI001F1F101F|nr:GNAT family N-acetyltransferase [Porphyromonas gingivalis]MCE8192370.1 GNAT family N-acetyltransferase [Porphyromonas gingivalis]